jgi:hypothetical protein
MQEIQLLLLLVVDLAEVVNQALIEMVVLVGQVVVRKSVQEV